MNRLEGFSRFLTDEMLKHISVGDCYDDDESAQAAKTAETLIREFMNRFSDEEWGQIEPLDADQWLDLPAEPASCGHLQHPRGYGCTSDGCANDSRQFARKTT